MWMSMCPSSICWAASFLKAMDTISQPYPPWFHQAAMKENIALESPRNPSSIFLNPLSQVYQGDFSKVFPTLNWDANFSILCFTLSKYVTFSQYMGKYHICSFFIVKILQLFMLVFLFYVFVGVFFTDYKFPRS